MNYLKTSLVEDWLRQTREWQKDPPAERPSKQLGSCGDCGGDAFSSVVIWLCLDLIDARNTLTAIVSEAREIDPEICGPECTDIPTAWVTLKKDRDRWRDEAMEARNLLKHCEIAAKRMAQGVLPFNAEVVSD